MDNCKQSRLRSDAIVDLDEKAASDLRLFCSDIINLEKKIY